MFYFLLFITTAAQTVTCFEILGVTYFVDNDFHKLFNKTRCGEKLKWTVVDYDSLEIDRPFGNSMKAIKSARNSCASSFEFMIYSGVLEVNVYANLISEKSGVTITVMDLEDNPIASVKYGLLANFTGWQTVIIKVAANGLGYINLMGSSLDQEMILIDSFEYKPNKLEEIDKNSNHYKDKRDAVKALLTEGDLSYRVISDDDLDESSGDYSNEIEDIDSSGEEPDTDTEAPYPEPDTSPENELDTDTDKDDVPEEIGFWTPLNITFVSVIGGLVIALPVVGIVVYKLGLAAAAPDLSPLVFTEPEDMPNIVNLPRISRLHTESGFGRYDPNIYTGRR